MEEKVMISNKALEGRIELLANEIQALVIRLDNASDLISEILRILGYRLAGQNELVKVEKGRKK